MKVMIIIIMMMILLIMILMCGNDINDEVMKW